MRLRVGAAAVLVAAVGACSLAVLVLANFSTCSSLAGGVCATRTGFGTSTMGEVKDPRTYAALVFTPPTDGTLWPLLLYLHGAGESGDNLEGLISEGATGTPPVALKLGSALPVLSERFLVVAPQTARGWRADDISQFLDFLMSDTSGLSFDKKRVYVTGHSMGGYGALLAGTTRRFAAVVPVAPAGAVRAEQLQGVPVWAFHGKNDVIVPAAYSERIIGELKELGASADEARLTLYEEAPAPPGWPEYFGHASTIPAYGTPELYEWLLGKQLN